ncbi:DUF1622 domain-containing protein [Pontibacter sp. 172403-2]|uniref:DUF1622 domain-containing protein n=1 Tax=Pontibacter rufus TaxID=2791028 RepID=UPI0018B0145E|nr:DUF1622 domain-containing protein [Pontibacter sp. 172403-2]MBF9253771.1 DUF1622 domain-containing protein [Pontibacter sp. 172403-2]
MENTRVYIEYIARSLEAIGVITIAIGALIALVRFLFSVQNITPRSYKILRQELGKAILLGLEILVAADIIATVVTQPTMEQVLILGVVVLIRTFLSLSLEVELDGKFPWQAKKVNEQSPAIK